MDTNKIWMRLLMASMLLALLFTTACGMEKAIKGPAELVQLGVNKPSVITCAAQLLKVLGVDSLTEGSFMPPSTSSC